MISYFSQYEELSREIFEPIKSEISIQIRMVVNLFNTALTMQYNQFKTRQVMHPQAGDLPIVKKAVEYGAASIITPVAKKA